MPLNICFHGIGTPPASVDSAEAGYWVGADDFRRILDEITGWPAVAISFDDGNASDLAIGLPELTSRGLTAAFFPVAGRLGSAGSMAGDDLRELVSQGMTVGSHGMAHRSWRGMGAVTTHDELVAARELIANAAGSAVTEAACPLGRYDRRLLADLRRLGYRRVYTSDRRPASARGWLQPRFSVRAGDTPQSLRETVFAGPRLTARIGRSAAAAVKRLR
jgi:peptidoglycan/xylan/chitin deacetylase (PgdA/CDA1 family)